MTLLLHQGVETCYLTQSQVKCFGFSLKNLLALRGFSALSLYFVVDSSPGRLFLSLQTDRDKQPSDLSRQRSKIL